MTRTTVFLLAAGEQKRWLRDNDVTQEPKHLIKLCGERLLDRSARLLSERIDGVQIRVVVRDMADERFKVPGTRRTAARLDEGNGDTDKFLSSRHSWPKTGRIVLLYGDLFVSDALADAIASCDTGEDGWRFFGRLDKSSKHEHPGGGGECWGFVIDEHARPLFDAAAAQNVAMHAAGEIYRNGGWELYRAMAGASTPGDVLDHRDWGHATWVDDWTEDFDMIKTWRSWCWAWSQASPDDRPEHLGRD